MPEYFPNGGGMGGWKPIDYMPQVPAYASAPAPAPAPVPQQGLRPQPQPQLLMPGTTGGGRASTTRQSQADDSAVRGSRGAQYGNGSVNINVDGDAFGALSSTVYAPSQRNAMRPCQGQSVRASESLGSRRSARGEAARSQQPAGNHGPRLVLPSDAGLRPSRANPMAWGGADYLQVPGSQHGGSRGPFGSPGTSGSRSVSTSRRPSGSRRLFGLRDVVSVQGGGLGVGVQPSDIGPPRSHGAYGSMGHRRY